MSAPTLERRKDGLVLFTANGDPILKLCDDACLLHSFGPHLFDSRAAKLSPEALEALRDWATEALAT